MPAAVDCAKARLLPDGVYCAKARLLPDGVYCLTACIALKRSLEPSAVYINVTK